MAVVLMEDLMAVPVTAHSMEVLTLVLTQAPILVLTQVPTLVLTAVPTQVPTLVLTLVPTQAPILVLTAVPTQVPILVLTAVPTQVPTLVLTVVLTLLLVAVLTLVLTEAPTVVLTAAIMEAHMEAPLMVHIVVGEADRHRCHTTASTNPSSTRSQSCNSAEALKPKCEKSCVAGSFVVAMMAYI